MAGSSRPALAACNGRLLAEVGTCRFGAVAGKHSPLGVPDSKPRALEVRRIEQVDSTCMPVVVSEHTDRTFRIEPLA